MAGHRRWLLGAIMTTAVTACDPDDIADVGDIAERSAEANSFRLNSFRLNSFRLNGFRLNGLALDGFEGADEYIRLTEIRLPNGPAVTQSWLVGSNLHVQTEYGAVLSGPQLAGAEFLFEVTEGAQGKEGKRVKIGGVKPMALLSDVWFYDLAIQDSGGPWQPLCVDGDNLATTAILLGDVWDPETGDRVSPRPTGAITFACRGAALAKCVEWGYPPWKSFLGTSLASYHQTCTRAVRADYCGDGTPHTLDGVEFHVKDALSIQIADLLTPYVVEAEWSPGGALCLNPDNTRLPDPTVACDLPTCNASLANKSLIQTGTLLDP